MKELIVAPIFIIFIAGFALELVNFAEDSSVKVTSFAGDMTRATDCAVNGVELSKCSPNLDNYDFKQDLNEYQDMNEQYLEEIKDKLDGAQIEERDGKIILTIEKD